MKLPDKNAVIVWLIIVPLIVVIWALSGYLLYEIASAVFW